MSKITVTTIAGQTSGGDANKVIIESGDTLQVDSNATVGGTLGVTGATTLSGATTFSGGTTFQQDINIGTTTNLLSNGDFTTNTTGWAATGSALAISSGALQITPNSGVNGFANQQVDNLVVGKSYIASVVVTQDAGNYARLYIGTSANGNQTVTSASLGTGTHSFTFVATATTHHFALVVGGGTGQVTKFDAARLTEASRIIFPSITGTAPEIKQGTTVNDLAFATNQVNRLNIDVNGNVTTPAQPSFQAKVGTNSTFDANSVSNAYVNYDTDVYDTGNNHNNGIFTAPVAGVYYFRAEAYTDTYATQSWFIVNGSRTAASDTAYRSNDTNSNFAGNSVILKLAANDTVGFHPYRSGNSSMTVNANANHSWFRGMLIG